MLAIRCKHCDQFSFIGYTNEYKEEFCSKECYTKYCFENNCEADLDKLVMIEELNNNCQGNAEVKEV